MDSRSIRGLWSPDVYFEGLLIDGLSFRTAAIRAHVDELGVRMCEVVDACEPFGLGASNGLVPSSTVDR